MATVKETIQVIDDFDAAYAGAIDFLPPNKSAATTSSAERTSCQAQVREMLAKEFYGAIPPQPDSISVSRKPIAGERAERVQIKIAVAEGRFSVGAALWLPQDTSSPAPLICGLDFIGPVGLMNSSGFPIDPHARVSSRPDYGARDMRIKPQNINSCASQSIRYISICC